MNPEKIENHIRKRYADKLFDVNCLAEELKISKSYLREIINMNYNCCPHHLIEMIRLERVIILLSNEQKYIYSVCSNVGYANFKTFRTAFKKCTKMTPTEFKNVIKKSINVQKEIEKMINYIWNSSNI